MLKIACVDLIAMRVVSDFLALQYQITDLILFSRIFYVIHAEHNTYEQWQLLFLMEKNKIC
jgi:hypothetical protein